jgi:hypothetical protein
MLNDETLRLRIRSKLQNRLLPHDGIRAAWSSPSAGETFDACGTVLNKDQLLMEGTMLDRGRTHLQMHVRCFQIWDQQSAPP